MLQVRVLGACLEDPASACLIMELVEGGNLSDRIHDRRKRRLTYLQILQVREAALLSCKFHLKQHRACSCAGGIRQIDT